MLQSKAGRWHSADAAAPRRWRVRDSSAKDGRARLRAVPAHPRPDLCIFWEWQSAYCAFLLEGLLILRGARSRVFRLFPLFYSYIIYIFCGSLGMYLIYWLDPHVYPSAYWIYYLVSILVEFTVLVEISDQIFRPFPAIRNLGRALTIVISVGLGLVYILPTILGSARQASRAARFCLAGFCNQGHYSRRFILCGSTLWFRIGEECCRLNARILHLPGDEHRHDWPAGKAFEPALCANILWVMAPLASALCLLVWTVSLWELAPMPSMSTISPVAGRDSEAVALELTRFNSELSKFLHK